MSAANGSDSGHPGAAGERKFREILTFERTRVERSSDPFILMLLDAHQENGTARRILLKAIGVLGSAARETDLLGWYVDGEILGVIFAELGKGKEDPVLAGEILRDKIRTSLQERLGTEAAAKITISVHVFPEKVEVTEYQTVIGLRVPQRSRIKLSLKK